MLDLLPQDYNSVFEAVSQLKNSQLEISTAYAKCSKTTVPTGQHRRALAYVQSQCCTSEGNALHVSSLHQVVTP